MPAVVYLGRVACAVVAAGIALAGCQSQGQGATLASRGDCATLEGRSIEAEKIGLPSGGARITSSLLVLSAAGAPTHCLVNGAISPVDFQAPDIRFSVTLPVAWNGRALMFGGSGFDGVVPAIEGPIFAQPANLIETPLARGYATFGSDGGHQSTQADVPTPAVDAAFAMNDEALHNFAGDALKKTRDAAVWIMSEWYGRPPQRTYFAGGSNGGREGLVAIQRWPTDFDGAIIAYPFWSAGSTALTFGAVMAPFEREGGYIPPAQQAFIHQAVMAACDGLDGVNDGLVSNAGACNVDPATLSCAAGAPAETCLSSPQLAALKKYEAGATFPYRAGRGEAEHPGFPVISGANLGGAQQLSDAPPSHPATRNMPTIAHFWDQFMRYAIARDPGVNPWTVDPEAPGLYATRINTVVDLLDMKPIDLAAFRARGGKLLLFHGLADPIVSPRTTNDYWSRLGTMMGPSTRADFARYYVVPGFGHGAGGSNDFQPAWDSMGALEEWVENDTPPPALTMTDFVPGHRNRTRPLCEFGSWPRYVSGPVDAAQSFVCSTD